MSSSTSSEDDFFPQGISMLNISGNKGDSNVTKKVEKESFEDDFTPPGIGMLNISGNKGESNVTKKVEKESSKNDFTPPGMDMLNISGSKGGSAVSKKVEDESSEDDFTPPGIGMLNISRKKGGSVITKKVEDDFTPPGIGTLNISGSEGDSAVTKKVEDESSEDDFTPLGIGMLNISRNKNGSAVTKKVEDESSEDDFTPLGIGMLNISKNKGGSVITKKVEEEKSDLPPALQYINLLNSAMEILKKTRSEGDDERLKLTINAVRKGRKTFLNVVELANQLHRQPDHLAFFIAKDLLTEGSVNKDGQMILNGIYLKSEIEKALRHYIELYVICKTCKNVNETYITRESKLFFLRCDKCNGSKCMGNVIEGFTIKDKPQPKPKGLT